MEVNEQNIWGRSAVYLGLGSMRVGLTAVWVSQRLEEGITIMGILRSVWNERSVSVMEKMAELQDILVLKALHGFSWALNVTQKMVMGWI